ncbi:MAG: hypothetical protein QXT63_09620 [Thermoplasmata archaeon]
MGGECKKKRNWHEINEIYVERVAMFFYFEKLRLGMKNLQKIIIA